MAVRRVILVLFIAIVFVASFGVNSFSRDAHGPEPTPLVRVTVTQVHMGMPVRIRVYASDVEAGRGACRHAFGRIALLNQVFSDYEPDSELNRVIARAGEDPLLVSPELHTVLSVALRIARQSEGRLDPTAAPLIRLWRSARAQRHLPDSSEIDAALQRVGYQHLTVDADACTVRFHRDSMQLDLGAVAKGYIGDAALDALRERGMTRAMVEAGGDMVFGDPPPGQSGWLVQPDHPGLPDLRLANMAASISGQSVQFTEIGGRSYGHIIDPRTGVPVAPERVSLVVAANGLTADPLATLGTLMPVDEYHHLLDTHYPDVQAWVVAHAVHVRPTPMEPSHD